MVATTQPIETHLNPLAASDFLSGPRTGPVLGFAAALHSLLSPETVSPHGQHTLAATQPSALPLAPTDFIPGLRTKGPTRPLNPLATDRLTRSTRHAANNGDIQKQAEKWVAQTFFGTLLKQMHDSPFKSDLFSGGRGGKAFEPMMDQHLADHMSRGTGRKLVQSIVRRLASKAYKSQEKSGKAGRMSDPFSDLNTANSPAEQGQSPQPEQTPANGRLPRGDDSNPFTNVRVHVAPSLRG